MSLNVFVAVCILGVDFLIYVLFQWMYGDKRRAMEQKLAAHRSAMKEEVARPFVVKRGGAETRERIRKVRARMLGRTA